MAFAETCMCGTCGSSTWRAKQSMACAAIQASIFVALLSSMKSHDTDHTRPLMLLRTRAWEACSTLRDSYNSPVVDLSCYAGASGVSDGGALQGVWQ